MKLRREWLVLLIVFDALSSMSAVVVTAAYGHSLVEAKPPPCRDQFGRTRTPSFCNNRDEDKQ